MEVGSPLKKGIWLSWQGALVNCLVLFGCTVSFGLDRVIGLQCPHRVALLDYFEGETLRAYHYLSIPGQNSNETTANYLKQLSVTMPDRAQLYLGQLPGLLQQLKMSSIPLGEPDTTELIIRPPANCRFVNLAVTAPTGSTVSVDQKLWSQLSAQDQMGTLIHLLMVGEIRASGQELKSSIYLRALNSALLSIEFSKLPLANVIPVYQAAQVYSLRIQGVLVDLARPLALGAEGLLQTATPLKGGKWSYAGQSVELKSETPVKFHPNGFVKSLRFKGKLVVPYRNNQLPFVTPDHLSSAPFEGEQNPVISFYPSGSVEQGFVTDSVNLMTERFRVKLATEKGRFENVLNSHLFFFETGEVKLLTHALGSVFWKGQWIRLAKNASVDLFSPQQLKELVIDQTVNLVVQNRQVGFNGYLSFYENGFIDCAYPTQNIKFTNAQGKAVASDADTQVCFDSAGWVIGN